MSDGEPEIASGKSCNEYSGRFQLQNVSNVFPDGGCCSGS